MLWSYRVCILTSQEDTDDFGSVDTTGKGARMTCPNCGSSDISANEWEADGQAASCTVSCDDEDCGWIWREHYTANYWNKIL